MPANSRSVHIPGKAITDSHYLARGKLGAAEFRLKVQVISPIDTDPSLKAKVAAVYADQAREQLEQALGPAETNKAVEQHGMQGREFFHRISKSDSPNGQELAFQQRVLFDGKRLYTATYVGSPDAGTIKSGKLFLDSVQPFNGQANSAHSKSRAKMLSQKNKPASTEKNLSGQSAQAKILAERIAGTRGSATYVSTRNSKQIIAPMHFAGAGHFYTILMEEDSSVEVRNGIFFITDGVLSLTYSDELFNAFIQNRDERKFFFKPVADSSNGRLILKPVSKDPPHRPIDVTASSSRYTESISEIRISGIDPRLSAAQRLDAFAAAPRSAISFTTKAPGVQEGDVILVDDTTVIVTLPDGRGNTDVEKGTYRVSGERIQFAFKSGNSEFAISTTKDDKTLELKPSAGKSTGDSLIGQAAKLLISAK